MDRAPAADVLGLLAKINTEHSMRWTLVGKLAGGYQQGAYELTDGAGARVVLKWHTGHLPAKQLRETARAIEDARARGWPSSKWLAYRRLPNDGAYIVEEVVAGVHPQTPPSLPPPPLLGAAPMPTAGLPADSQGLSAYIEQ